MEGFWWRPDIARGRRRLGAMRARRARCHQVETRPDLDSERATAYVTAPAGLLGRLRVLVLALALQMMGFNDDDPAVVHAGCCSVASTASAEQTALLAPKPNKIYVNSDPGAGWSTWARQGKKEGPPISPLRAVWPKPPTANIAHLSHFDPLCFYSSRPWMLLSLATDTA
ncbi:uncharacterized protein TrAtP1_003446 [Trichoderma atroviride]|uniref:uncharacterized protein n=1 Tax=Hypocrea atroviridis TaxID=63577 RepID=UPI0033165103|nr:hypothetical protein TrAtP1_003446 [Trichoderma atroviride]